MRNQYFTYIGQTKCTNDPLQQHNHGSGAIDTSNEENRPYAMDAYICGLGHMDDVSQMGVEKKWRDYQGSLPLPTDDVMSIMDQGCCIVNEWNKQSRSMSNDYVQFTFVCMVQRCDQNRE
jgi:hypothetical protein